MEENIENTQHKAPNNNLNPSIDNHHEANSNTSWIQFEDDKTKDKVLDNSPSVHIDIATGEVQEIRTDIHDGPAIIGINQTETKPINHPLKESPSSELSSPVYLPPPPTAPPRHSKGPEREDGNVAPILETSPVRNMYVETSFQNSTSQSPQQNVGFSNGDILVTLLPLNTRCPWITKAIFRPELVPEELMAPGLTLTVEDYVMAMQMLINDVRFNMYIVCYKRVLLVWIVLGFLILLSLLFSGVRGLALFGGGIVWLILNAFGIFICMWLKVKLYRQLEQAIASVNAHFYKHHILIGLDDRGKLSCHKINLIFVFFDVTYCMKFLKDMLENTEIAQDEQNSTMSKVLNTKRMDIDKSDIIITGSSNTRLSQKEKYAEKLILRYSQRWVKEFNRKRIALHLPLHPDGTETVGSPLPIRHCRSARCPCQYIDEHLRFKPTTRFSIREIFS